MIIPDSNGIPTGYIEGPPGPPGTTGPAGPKVELIILIFSILEKYSKKLSFVLVMSGLVTGDLVYFQHFFSLHVFRAVLLALNICKFVQINKKIYNVDE